MKELAISVFTSTWTEYMREFFAPYAVFTEVKPEGDGSYTCIALFQHYHYWCEGQNAHALETSGPAAVRWRLDLTSITDDLEQVRNLARLSVESIAGVAWRSGLLPTAPTTPLPGTGQPSLSY
jgi:hypothetical protein